MEKSGTHTPESKLKKRSPNSLSPKKEEKNTCKKVYTQAPGKYSTPEGIVQFPVSKI